jgi:hypothetical protein
MKIIYALCFILGAISTARGAEPISDNTSLKIEISINEDSLKTDFYKKVNRFYIDTKIKNIGNTNQEITIWYAYGWSWTSSSTEVSPGHEALKNFPYKVTLKPNEEYTGKVEMISDAVKKRPLTFQLGFFPKAELPLPEFTDPKKSRDIIWSNTVTLKQ